MVCQKSLATVSPLSETLGRPYQGAGQGRKGTRRLLVLKQIECGKEKSMTEQMSFKGGTDGEKRKDR